MEQTKSDNVPSGGLSMLDDEKRGNDDGFISIPFYDAQLAAGGGMFNGNENVVSNIEIDKKFFKALAGNSKPEGLTFLEVRGDSMAPTVSNGDTVLIDLKDKNIYEGIMAFVFEGDAYIKRIRKMFDGIDIISDNKEFYPPYSISKNQMDQFHIIGRILSVSHFF